MSIVYGISGTYPPNQCNFQAIRRFVYRSTHYLPITSSKTVHLSNRSKSALGSQLLAILEEKPRERRHSHCQKGKQTRRPLKAKRVVHLDTKERERRWKDC